MPHYIEIIPDNYNNSNADINIVRDDLQNKINNIDYNVIIAPGKATLINSGTGSGKTRIIFDLVHKFMNAIDDNKIIHIICSNDTLSQQFKKSYEIHYPDRNKLVKIIGIDLHKFKKIEKTIDECIIKDITVVLVWPHLSHENGNLSELSNKFVTTISEKQEDGIEQLVIIDEIHEQLTRLSGGLNPSIYNNKHWVGQHKKVKEQTHNKLNIFDKIRSKNIPVILLSATLNNILLTKMPSMGYKSNDITIINCMPIRSLSSKTQLQHIDITDYSVIEKEIDNTIQTTEDKVLIVSKSSIEINKLIKIWNIKQKKIPYSIYTNEHKSIDELNDARIIFSIELMTTGFDSSTHFANTKVGLVVILRKFSDKQSNGMSNNDEHECYIDISAKLCQTIGRLRERGKALIDNSFDHIKTLYNVQYNIFNAIKNGYDLSYKISGEPYQDVKNPKEKCLVPISRYNQIHLNNLIVNIRDNDDDDLKVISNRITKLEGLTGRNIRNEYLNSIIADGTDDFDSAFWVENMIYLWNDYIAEY